VFVFCGRSRFQSSTKVEALREELELMRRHDPSAKAIVFSQFTSMLELIGFRLEQVRPLACRSTRGCRDIR
jgi:SNF2 family DNA or RNA helicase